MKKSNCTIHSIIVLLSSIWSNILLSLIVKMDCFRGYSKAARIRSVILVAVIFGITLIYNSMVLVKCYKPQNKEQGGSKAPFIMSMIGLILFLVIAGFVAWAYVFVAATGGV